MKCCRLPSRNKQLQHKSCPVLGVVVAGVGQGSFMMFIPLFCLCLCSCVLGVGWRAAIRPADHPVANFDFDVVVGADGRRNTLEGEKKQPRPPHFFFTV